MYKCNLRKIRDFYALSIPTEYVKDMRTEDGYIILDIKPNPDTIHLIIGKLVSVLRGISLEI